MGVCDVSGFAHTHAKTHRPHSLQLYSNALRKRGIHDVTLRLERELVTCVVSANHLKAACVNWYSHPQLSIGQRPPKLGANSRTIDQNFLVSCAPFNRFSPRLKIHGRVIKALSSSSSAKGRAVESLPKYWVETRVLLGLFGLVLPPVRFCSSASENIQKSRTFCGIFTKLGHALCRFLLFLAVVRSNLE